MELNNYVVIAYGVVFTLIASFSIYVILRDRFMRRLLNNRSFRS